MKSKDMQMKQRAAAMGQQNGGNMQMGNSNMGMNANNAQQTPVSQATAPNNFDFSSIMGQQQNAIKSQESGEQVVPASNNNMSLGQMNMSQGVNPQQLLANQNNQGGNANQMQFLAMQQRMNQEKQRQMNLQQGMGGQQGQNAKPGKSGIPEAFPVSEEGTWLNDPVPHRHLGDGHAFGLGLERGLGKDLANEGHEHGDE